MKDGFEKLILCSKQLRHSRVVYSSYSVLYFLSLYRANKQPISKYGKIKV